MNLHVDGIDQPIKPGSKFNLSVSGDNNLHALKIEIYDSKNNLRMMQREPGYSTNFSTDFPKTKLLGEWRIEIYGYLIDQPEITSTKTFQIISEELEETQREEKLQKTNNEGDPKDEQKDNEYAFSNIPDEPTKDMDNTSLYDQLGENVTDSSELTNEEISSSPLTAVNGIGAATETKLNDAGFHTINEVAKAEVGQLVTAGIQEAQAKQIIDNSKKFIQEH